MALRDTYGVVHEPTVQRVADAAGNPLYQAVCRCGDQGYAFQQKEYAEEAMRDHRDSIKQW